MQSRGVQMLQTALKIPTSVMLELQILKWFSFRSSSPPSICPFNHPLISVLKSWVKLFGADCHFVFRMPEVMGSLIASGVTRERK